MRDGASSNGASTATHAAPARGPTPSWTAHHEPPLILPDGAARPSEPRLEQYLGHRHQDSRFLYLTKHNGCHISLAQNSS